MRLKQQQLRDLTVQIDVTSFSNYRDFLNALYVAAKEMDPRYSYVHLSDDLGLGSTNAFAMIQGKRKLSEKIALRIADRLGLSLKQRKYLAALSQQAHARTSELREKAFQEQLEVLRDKLPTDLDRRRLLFFEHWYHAAILEILRLEDASDDPEWIAKTINPEVSLTKIKASLELLASLNYVALDKKKGRLYPTEVNISTGDEVERLAILSYHRQMIDLAVTAMDRIPAEERDISAITVAVSAKLQEQFKQELIALRKRFLKLSTEEKHPAEIVQINLQLFSLTHKRGAS